MVRLFYKIALDLDGNQYVDEVSLIPHDACFYVDLDENTTWNASDEFSEKFPYNGIHCIDDCVYLYNHTNNQSYNSPIADDYWDGNSIVFELADGTVITLTEDDYESNWTTEASLYQEFKDGKPIGEPFVKENFYD